MKVARSAIAMIALAIGQPALSQREAPSPQVRTQSGPIRGAVSSDGAIASYLGLPFAAPPIGDLRWRAPQPPRAWKGVRDATRFSADCPQPGTSSVAPPRHFAEDCLYLNVWAPARRPAKPLPVMVWIFGGSFLHGGASQAGFDAKRLADRGVVVVTLNHRLGSLGFMAHPDLTREAGTSGNYGLLDQVAALEWVKRNIGAFGGDPAAVTLFGQSSGAISTQTLMATPAAKGLFTRAIVQSGPIWGLSQMPRSLKDLEGVGQRMAARRGLTTIAEMRRLPADSLIATTPEEDGGLFLPFFPIVDGKVVPTSSAEAFFHGREAPVPMIVGYTADEFSQSVPKDMTPAAFEAIIRRDYGAEADRYLALYPHAGPADARRAMVQSKVYPIYDGAIGQAEWHARKSPTWLYRFDRVAPGLQAAPHGADVPYTFDAVDTPPFAATDRALAADLVGYWTNFARTGNPNGAGLPEWTRFDPATPQLMSFGDVRTTMPVADLARIRASRRPAETRWIASFSKALP
jgi:para-nitrobenzyl esterase